MIEVDENKSNICPHCNKVMEPTEGCSEMDNGKCTIWCAYCGEKYYYLTKEYNKNCKGINMRITYAKTAYVECPDGILDEITQSLGCIAEGNGQAVVNFDSLEEWLDEEENKEEGHLYNFLSLVKAELDNEVENLGEQIGEIIFSS